VGKNFRGSSIEIQGTRKNMNKDYYLRFPSVLRNALKEGKVGFPKDLETEYGSEEVYRGVKYTENKKKITQEDFKSQMEKGLPGFSETDIKSYSCSCFRDLEELHMAVHFPKKGRAVAKGIMRSEHGPRVREKGTTHIHWYLYDEIDPSDEFEVIEVWEKNGSK